MNTKMKKILVIGLCLATALGLFACGGGDKKESKDGAEIAMITDKGTIDDKSFNQGTWEGIKEFAEKEGKTYKYYQPTEDTDAARMEQIDLAVKGGAKVIVTPGFLFEKTIGEAEEKYPDVKFILIDGNPVDKDGNVHVADNAVGITFAEEQAGYLAGYAAVADGYTKLGYMGGQPVPAVVRYGYGFVKGANDAAKELGETVDIKYGYAGGFSPTPEIQAKAAGWYSSGTEVIFACGGGIYSSITAAAEAADKAVIGVDVDQSAESKTIVTSATKGLSTAVQKELKAFYDDKFPGGESIILGAKDDAVGLPMDTSKFKKFNKEQYDKLYSELKEGKIKDIPTDKSVESADKIDAPNVHVEMVE